jgi:hypothetical protein
MEVSKFSIVDSDLGTVRWLQIRLNSKDTAEASRGGNWGSGQQEDAEKKRAGTIDALTKLVVRFSELPKNYLSDQPGQPQAARFPTRPHANAAYAIHSDSLQPTPNKSTPVLQCPSASTRLQPVLTKSHSVVVALALTLGPQWHTMPPLASSINGKVVVQHSTSVVSDASATDEPPLSPGFLLHGAK